jgi:hypothetical protein
MSMEMLMIAKTILGYFAVYCLVLISCIFIYLHILVISEIIKFLKREKYEKHN